ncbi:MAG: hypothetical protein JXQ75_23045 [Phycisphaerae bacterium]|nr:hypothetical protein [Phycisphaerae bacterium]
MTSVLRIDARSRPCTDRPAPSAILPGALVAVLALVGVDYVMTASMAAERVHRGTSVAARAVVPSGAAVRARAHQPSWTATVLIVLLVLGRQIVSIVLRPAAAGLVRPVDNVGRILLLRRKTSISYYTGGLYGP